MSGENTVGDPLSNAIRVETNGIGLNVVTAGPPDGPPLLLLHGFPEFWYGWYRQIGPLASAGYRVVVPDQRGYNLSDKPTRVRDYGLDVLVSDALGLLDALGHETAFVAGHDWGGAVAWWTALRAPERVRRLAVLNVPHPRVLREALRTTAAQRRRSRYMAFFQLPWLPEFTMRRGGWSKAEHSIRGTALPGTFDETDMRRYREAWSRPGAIRSMIHWYRAALRHPPRERVDVRVRVPTLMLWGARDRFLGGELIEPSLALCDDGRVVRLDAATHWLQHEEPQRVADELIRFFGEARHSAL